MKEKKNNISIGNSGEYFAAGELERHGFTAAVSLSNTSDFDILAIDRNNFKQFAIQVKTTSYRQKVWSLGPKNEYLEGDNIIYIFVTLNELDTPEYHIVPSRIVAKDIREGYIKWLNTPGKKGQPHKENTIRKFTDKEDIYLNNWDCLK